MTAEFNTCGSSHLAKKSTLVHERAKLGAVRNILLIEDESLDAERLTATLRVLFGYDMQIRWAATLGDAVNAVMAEKPSVVFLDDILKPSANATQAIPMLREAGYAGPIIVVSGQVTYPRRSGLLADGACDVIHKDDIDSVRVAEALARLNVPKTDTAPDD